MKMIWVLAKRIWKRMGRGLSTCFYKLVLRWTSKESGLSMFPLIAVFMLAVFAFVGWSILEKKPFIVDDVVSNHTRNIVLVMAAIIGLPLALWRSYVNERQANTSRRAFLNDRYQRAAEMLGHDLLTVRLAGIYALQNLAKEFPGSYHIQVMQVFSAFVRHPPSIGHSLSPAEVPQVDVNAVMRAIGSRDRALVKLERRNNYKIDLSNSNLQNYNLRDLNLSNVVLSNSVLSKASLISTDLREAQLIEANLSGAKVMAANCAKSWFASANLTRTNFSMADLSEANFSAADLSGARLAGAKMTKSILYGSDLTDTVFADEGLVAEGLTQRQINMAKNTDNPPILDMMDQKTGRLIAWDKRPLMEPRQCSQNPKEMLE